MKPASTDSEDSDDELDIELKRFTAINLFGFKKILYIFKKARNSNTIILHVNAFIIHE